MIFIKKLDQDEFQLCFELDSNSMNLWNKKQWENEFNKKAVKVYALFLENKIIGICTLEVISDEGQINYFLIKEKFRKKGYGTYLMRYLIKQCENLNLQRILLEVSQVNFSAEKFYSNFNFLTVGRRKKYYRDGSDAVLKEKYLIK
tara:strand:+ start:523 stop:960 length:438 start_codon:yes stop_codon:yes gene_type:complete